MARRSKRRVKTRSKAHRKSHQGEASRKKQRIPRSVTAPRSVAPEGRARSPHVRTKPSQAIGFDDHAVRRASHPIDGAVVADGEVAKRLFARRRRGDVSCGGTTRPSSSMAATCSVSSTSA